MHLKLHLNTSKRLPLLNECATTHSFFYIHKYNHSGRPVVLAENTKNNYATSSDFQKNFMWSIELAFMEGTVTQ